MKPVAFDYARPATLEDAFALLGREGISVKVLAGGQSLGPMLNLRLVQPDLLVDVTGIPELTRVEEDAESVTLGACVTHAAIEDGRVPDGTHGALPAVARGIAYRAVRTRGTIGGSLAHADPSADWMSCLSALGAEAVIAGPGGRRWVPVADFMIGVFETALKPGELLEALRIPKLRPGAGWGYYKVCRKTGEFAHAIGAVLLDRERALCRAVVGATEAPPIVFGEAAALFGGDTSGPLLRRFDATAAGKMLADRGFRGDAVARQIHLAALRRAAAQVQ
jgi:carbon-monoxide dehydrogenase medium subunit